MPRFIAHVGIGTAQRIARCLARIQRRLLHPVVAGLAVQALSDWRIRHAGEGGLLMSFTNIRSPAMADGLARRLREAIAI